MTIVIGLALVVLGLAIGFIIAWAFGVGASMGLFIGLLLVASLDLSLNGSLMKRIARTENCGGS